MVGGTIKLVSLDLGHVAMETLRASNKIADRWNEPIETGGSIVVELDAGRVGVEGVIHLEHLNEYRVMGRVVRSAAIVTRVEAFVILTRMDHPPEFFAEEEIELCLQEMNDP